MHRFASWLALACGLVACRSPTQISVDVQTDVPCAQVTSTAFTSGELGAIESSPATAASTTCSSDGHLGTVVLVPSGDDSAQVGFKVVTALNGRTTDACSGPAASNDTSCIVARRALRYIPHTPLVVLVDMTQACEGLICGPTTTCVNGACVSAVIPDPSQCEGSGCNATVLGPADAGVDATVGRGDAAPESGDDASTDAGATDSATDAGTPPVDSGAADDAGVCSPGAQQCAGGTTVQVCGTNGRWGAPWACATGTCSGGACSGSTPETSNPSCAGGGPGRSTCGVDGGDSCCASLEVPGGTYDRTYQNAGTGPSGQADPAIVNGYRLDEYLVTVGRFRQFVNAWDGGAGLTGGNGYEPGSGSGKHAHLNGGQGLVDVGNDAGLSYEPGWSSGDDTNLSPTNANLACGPEYATWTDAPASQESLPINCVVWQEAYAFCIWDGGFLPSEAEWSFAAAGGSLLFEYPWGDTDPTTQPNQYAIYGDGAGNCYYPSGALAACADGGTSNIAPVGFAPLGAGSWGQLDLGGELFEWNLDWYYFYVDPCVSCGYVTGYNTGYRVIRGGAFNVAHDYMSGGHRYYGTPTARGDFIGFRCARTP